MNWKARAALFAAALWWGSLTAIGFMAVPLLFAHAATPSAAGSLAARLFAGQTWMSLGCGVLLLVAARTEEDPPRMDWAGGALGLVVAGLLLALLAQFGVAPRIVARQNLPVWHTVGSLMYLAQWLCALLVLWRVAFRAGAPTRPAS